MTDSIRSASRVVCIQDIDYQLPADSCYHPAMDAAAVRRIRETVLDTLVYPNEFAKHQLAYILANVFTNPAAFRVWAIVFERDRTPVMVLRNTAFTQTTPRYRRVLLVKLDALADIVPPTVDSVTDLAAAAAATAAETPVLDGSTKGDTLPWWMLYILLAGLTFGASLTFCSLLTQNLAAIRA
jgi:hypothetical protein